MNTTSQNTPPQNSRPQSSADDHGAGRKAFIFYSNWYTDARRSLDDRQLAEFVLVIIRYASEGILPDDGTTPIVRTMFGLIRPAIDANLKKYEAVVEENRVKAKKSADNRRSVIKRITAEQIADVDVESYDVDNQQSQCLELIIDNRELIIDKEKEKGEEEARGDMLAQREEVKAYWREHHYRSDVDEFFDYYDRRHWVTSRGVRLRSWKRAAVMWEDKYCRDVLPVRRREARAQAAADAEDRNARQASEAASQRRDRDAQFQAEADRSARRHVTRELGLHMYRRAVLLTNGDEALAMDLMRRAPDDTALFKRLAEGYVSPSSPSPSDGADLSRQN